MKKIVGLLLIVPLLMCFNLPANSEEGTVLRRAKIITVRGDVLIRKSGTADWIKAEKDMILSEDDEIQTGADGYAAMVFDEKGSFDADDYDLVEIDKDTELLISEARYDKGTDTKATLLSLNLGKIVTSAATLKGKSKFEVETPTTIVGVRGTKYVVEYRPED